MAVTIGNWSTNDKMGGVVVSDTIPENYTPITGHGDIEYYGGFLLAESVANKDDAKLFASSKNILVLSAQVLKEVNRSDLPSVRELQALINKFI